MLQAVWSATNYLDVWSATNCQSVIAVCDPESEEFWGCYKAGNGICFRSVEEDTKTQESVADSNGYHIQPKPGPVLGLWNFSR